ncbi:BatA domain-containing protein [Porticoccaceae bacterium LTM1]|nr:BatA domain-containing protein [Porticoccaceae bacterium LTM1]
MNFANLSPLSVMAGIAALAGILYALQRLRIRFQEREVSTLIFWKEALNEAPVRTFTQRFRHFWAYLLILAICSLVWLAIAEPEWKNEAGSDFYVLLLDGSAGMARGDRFEQVVAELKADLERLPPSQRQVIWCGGEAKTLLNPGEHTLLLSKRLDNLVPEAVPASIERQLANVSATRRQKSDVQIRVYGDAPVRGEILEQLPNGVDVVRGSSEIESIAGNSGITALGVAEAASGEWGKVDVLFRIEGDDVYAPTVEEIEVQVNSQVLPSDQLALDSDGVTYRVADLPAEGGLLNLEITKADLLPLDNRAQIRLPNQQPIRVLLSNSLPAPMAMVLRADSAVELVTENPDVVVRAKGENLGGRVPALEFIAANLQDEAFVLGYQGESDAQAMLMAAMQQTGLGNIDITGLAEAAQRPIQVSAEQGDMWNFTLWRELLDSEYNFVQSRAFPLFISQSVRWLAGVERWYPYAAASQPLPAASTGVESHFVSDAGQLIDTLGADFIPNRAGELRRAGNSEPLIVSLLSRDSTTGAGQSALTEKGLGAFDLGVERNSLVWLLLLALIALLVEWWLYQKGRMP